MKSTALTMAHSLHLFSPRYTWLRSPDDRLPFKSAPHFDPLWFVVQYRVRRGPVMFHFYQHNWN